MRLIFALILSSIAITVMAQVRINQGVATERRAKTTLAAEAPELVSEKEPVTALEAVRRLNEIIKIQADEIQQLKQRVSEIETKLRETKETRE